MPTLSASGKNLFSPAYSLFWARYSVIVDDRLITTKLIAVQPSERAILDDPAPGTWRAAPVAARRKGGLVC